jgi:hypothetical protein
MGTVDGDLLVLARRTSGVRSLRLLSTVLSPISPGVVRQRAVVRRRIPIR